MMGRGLHRALVMATMAGILGTLVGCASTDEEPVVVEEFPQRVPEGHTGPFRTYWADGLVQEEGTYRDGRRHGVVRGFHTDGSLRFEGRFDDGISAGDIVMHHKGGGVSTTETITGSDRQGVRTEYYEDGQPRSETAFRDGKRHGPETLWHRNGQKAQEGHHEAGRPTGEWRFYDEQGQLTSVKHHWMAAGEPVGWLETAYRPGGQISMQSKVSIVDGVQFGAITLWHPNGQQASLTESRAGLRHGRDVSWDASGRKRSEGTYVDDRRDGPWRFFDESGRLVRTVEYAEGREVSSG